jgi:glycosyltransferase involved in cell wall biosynthesis
VIDLTLIIPLYNEEESLVPLIQWIEQVVSDKYDYEIILVDDGSLDGSWGIIEDLASGNKRIRAFKFRRNYGKSAALHTGFEASRGRVVITMDADMQDSPDEIPALCDMINNGGFDLVSGWKKKRHDPITKTIPSKFFNWFVRRVSGIKLHDFNCGLKAYSSRVVHNIEVYGEMHRYIPLLAHWSGFRKITEKVVEHYPRKFGKSKFGIDRYIKGFLDVMSIMFVGKFGKRPMHLFGTFGVAFFFVGFAMLLYLSILKVVQHTGGIHERPLFYFGILLLIVGAQSFLTGFIAELIVRSSGGRNRYAIEKKIDPDKSILQGSDAV